MGDLFFGAWVALGVCAGTLGFVLLLYGQAQWKRQESSFFSWEFFWRLVLSEGLVFSATTVFGLTLGGLRELNTENWALTVFLWFVGVLFLFFLGGVHFSIISHVHFRAARARRLNATRPV